MLDDESRNRDFPSLAGRTYFNSAAEGIPPRAVHAALDRYFRDKERGMDGRVAHALQWDAVRALTAECYGLSAEEIGICSCSSEAYNLAAMALQAKAGDEIIVNDLDFPAGATPWMHGSSPATVKVWRSRDGALRTDDLIPLLSPKTRLLTVSLVSFYNGFRVNLPEILAAVRKHSPALVAVDVTQALGRIPLDLRDADLIVSSTHKWILASHGGGLVGVPNARAKEWTVPAGGWFHLVDAFNPERFDRPAVSRAGAAGFMVGMPNYPAIYAIRAGLEYIKSVGVERINAHAAPLVQAAIEEVKKLPVEFLTPLEPDHLAGIFAFRHPRADAIHQHLARCNIHVMSHAGRIRIAIHGYNTMRDVEHLVRELKAAMN